MNLWHDFRVKAAKDPQRLVLADGEDERVVRAAMQAQKDGLAQPILIGSRRKIEAMWKQLNASGVAPCVDFQELSKDDQTAYVAQLRKIGKFKELSEADALSRLDDSLLFGCLYLKNGHGDGFIGGAARSTADTLRAVFSIIGLAPKNPILFGLFLIENKSASSTENSWVVLADCAVIPDPSPKQLAHIAIGAAAAYELFAGRPARIAFLSFSTHGSAEHPMVDKIRQARDMAREKAPALEIEGEWQADAALDILSARVKGVGDSPMAGAANVLIAPDLNCGNIAYKLIQRLGDCRAVGPILWGTAQPANDLSRGCSTEDVLDMMALTSRQAQARTLVS